jgi:hypothetical protein
VLTHIAQVLAPGGTLLATMATDHRAPHSAVDGGPLPPAEYYGNVDPVELEAHLRPLFEFVEVETHPQRGDLYVRASSPKRAVEGQ